MFEGIPIYRFKAPDTLFANGSVYPPNEGFCPCLQSGIQNVSTCRFSACHPGNGGWGGGGGQTRGPACLLGTSSWVTPPQASDNGGSGKMIFGKISCVCRQ